MGRRRSRQTRKIGLEALERRQMLSRDVVQAMALVHEMFPPRPDLDPAARTLMKDPQAAAGLGLGTLGLALRGHPGIARLQGPGALMAFELKAHPAYSARHGLDWMLQPLTAALDTTQVPPSSSDNADTDVTATTSTPPASTVSAPSDPAPVSSSPPVPVPVPAQNLSVAVGGDLAASVVPGGLSGDSTAYTITPQPLPDNMTFNRQTGALTFAPAPGQSGNYQFQVVASDGQKSYVEPVHVHVSQTGTATTEVSGQVVDENGAPLADYPVSIDGSSATTDSSGRFTLTGIAANPGPIHAGGPKADADGRQGLVAPVAQLAGHGLYANVNNVIAQPLVLPRIDWSPAAPFRQSSALSGFSVTNPGLPGFAIHVPADTSIAATANAAKAPTASGTLQVAWLPASVSKQHMPQGLSSGMMLYRATGVDLTKPVTLTMPNTLGLQPGAVVDLLTMNMTTGGHDSVGEMAVSADGKTMTSTAPVTLASARPKTKTVAPTTLQANVEPAGETTGYTFQGCLMEDPQSPTGTPISECRGCQTGANTAMNEGSSPPTVRTGVYYGGGGAAMASDAGLVTGEYFLDHQTVAYQSQGQDRGIDLQYSSAQANPYPVVQYQFTTPDAGDSSAITSISAQVSVGGVVQGNPTT